MSHSFASHNEMFVALTVPSWPFATPFVAAARKSRSTEPRQKSRCPGLNRRECPYARMLPKTEEWHAIVELPKMTCNHALPGVPHTLKAIRHELGLVLQERRKELIEGSSPAIEQYKWSKLPRPDVKQICEIGLNAGYSALMWLCAFEGAEYHSFDLARYNTTLLAIDFLKRAFPGRFRVTVGNTQKTLKEVASAGGPGSKCDVMSIDGDHRYDGARKDIENMRLLARTLDRDSLVLMDDLQCAATWCAEPTDAWFHAKNVSGLVQELGCDVVGCCAGWCWGHYL